MIRFILNNRLIETKKPEGTVLLDFLRYEMHLMGTKSGCREGDCGACTVLAGQLNKDGQVVYKSILSCLTPLINVAGLHIVTIEGINKEGITPVQKVMVDNGATQCGFCTPGFIMSLTGYSISENKPTYDKSKNAISGNICRCTGYKSIEKAAGQLNEILEKKDTHHPLEWLIKENFLPEWFIDIPERLKKIKPESTNEKKGVIVGGGTDLFVQKARKLIDTPINSVFINKSELKTIICDSGKCFLGGAVTPSEIIDNSTLKKSFPDLKTYFNLISSEPVRNMGTIAGNIVNASPIADLTIFFMSQDANLHIKSDNGDKRLINLRDFYTGYKQFQLDESEIIEQISFDLPNENTYFNFEKVSKRKHLDIASVNSAMRLEVNNNKIEKVFLATGGVFPYPFYASKTCTFLEGKQPGESVLKEALNIFSKEIKPISDIRGDKDYKSFLAEQLIIAHFTRFFPGVFSVASLLQQRIKK